MTINRTLLPIKAHFLFFMAAMGPILPQLPVFGKELGISSVVMGSVTGILPVAFLLAKPIFGMLVDVYRDYRKFIFMLLIFFMVASYAMMNFIPTRKRLEINFTNFDTNILDTCNVTDFQKEEECNNQTNMVSCFVSCINDYSEFLVTKNDVNNTENFSLCSLNNATFIKNLNNCSFSCSEDTESNNNCIYKTWTFWSFVTLLSIGTIGFNVVNSISDAICFDVIGQEYDYGKQRVWGTIGFGITALISGYVVDLFSGSQLSYTPAFIVMLIFAVCDFLACIKLKLPIIEAPKNICEDMKDLLSNRHVVVFMSFAVCAGIVDSFIIYFLFWYLEDLAIATETRNIKLLEGLIVAAETLGGEVLFFSIAGKILERIGHVNCLSLCFLNYALRLGFISVAPSPWWILPVEFIFQGPTYALSYTCIVAYANELAPPGASATMQGIAAGLDDGFGYAIGSFIGGLLYKYLDGVYTLQIFSAFGLFCSILHLVLHKTYLKNHEPYSANGGQPDYKSPENAVRATYESVE